MAGPAEGRVSAIHVFGCRRSRKTWMPATSAGMTQNAWLAARSAAYTPSGRIGGRKASPVSQGKKIQVSCDTSVMKVSTIGRPIGLA
jgi:hypothetical protein